MPDPAHSPLPPLDDWKAQLRQRIAAQRRHASATEGGPVTEPAEGIPNADDLELSLQRAAQLANVGASLPASDRLSLPRRLLARLTGRFTLYLLRLVTVDQQQFNELVLRILRTVDDRMHEQTAGADARLASLDERLAKHESQLNGLEEAIAVHRGHLSELAEIISKVRELPLASGDAGDGALPGPLRDRRGGLLGAALVALGPEHSSQKRESVVEAIAFDKAFHGSESEVGERQRRYVAYFEGQQDVLDIGCGRGVFLQLLGAAGIRARGVDNNREMVLRCREKGLDVECGDALTHLKSLPDESLGGVFCTKVIEHLQTSDLLQLPALVFRKLRPDGVFAVETLNPESLLVHYRWFWMDLTHVRLIHPETLKFLFRSSHFRNVECHFLPPSGEPPGIPPLPTTGDQSAEIDRFNAATDAFNKLLFGSLDYAVIGIRQRHR